MTCGGTLATLTRHELLERHPGIDSVIRHAGEVPVVELADRLAAGSSLEGVPGMTTREGESRSSMAWRTTRGRTMTTPDFLPQSFHPRHTP